MPPPGLPGRTEDEPRLDEHHAEQHEEQHASVPLPVARGAATPDPARGTPDPAYGTPDFAALVAPHTQAMLSAAAALIGPADAEDAAQEALTRAWQALPTLRDPHAARAWLLRITVNVCQHWRRRSLGRRQAHEFPLPAEDTPAASLFATVSTNPGSSDHTGALDLRRVLDHLPADYRIVVVLRYYAGMDGAEIAAALDISPVTVRTRHHRALALLRARLRESGITPPASFNTEAGELP